jgi:hypothetical protein
MPVGFKNLPHADGEPVEIVTDCRSETGVTVGLVDSLITTCRVLAPRDMQSVEVQEALKDLFGDEDFAVIQSAATNAASMLN